MRSFPAFLAVWLLALPAGAATCPEPLDLGKAMNPTNGLYLGATVQTCLTVATEAPKVDILWLVDRSTSMGPGIAAVRDNITNMTSQLDGLGMDWRLGLIGFVDCIVPYSPYPILNPPNWTNDIPTFAAQLNALNIQCGLERTLEVISAANNNMKLFGDPDGWRDCAQRVIIYVTDEGYSCAEVTGTCNIEEWYATGTCQVPPKSEASVVAEMLADGVIVHAISASADSLYPTLECAGSSLPEATGGVWLDYASSDYGPLLTALGQAVISQSPIVVRDPVPPQLAPVPASISNGGVLAGNEITWTLTDVGAGEVVTLCFDSEVVSGWPGNITNTAYASSPHRDEFPSNAVVLGPTGPTPSPSPTVTASPTVSSTPTITPTFTPSATATPTSTTSMTASVSPTGTSSPSATLTETPAPFVCAGPNLIADTAMDGPVSSQVIGPFLSVLYGAPAQSGGWTALEWPSAGYGGVTASEWRSPPSSLYSQADSALTYASMLYQDVCADLDCRTTVCVWVKTGSYATGSLQLYQVDAWGYALGIMAAQPTGANGGMAVAGSGSDWTQICASVGTASFPWHPLAVGYRVVMMAHPVWSSPPAVAYFDDLSLQVSCGTLTPTSTQSPTPTPSPTATATFSPSVTQTRSPTSTATATYSFTPTATRSATFSGTPTASSSPSVTATPTWTASATVSNTVTATGTRTASPTVSRTASPTGTYTITSSRTPTRTVTATFTRSQTATRTRTPTPWLSPTVTRSPTATPTPVEPGDLIEEKGIYPNPFIDDLKVYYLLREDSEVTCTVYNVAGEVIFSMPAPGRMGMNHFVWRGENQAGARIASGVYGVRVSAQGRTRQGEFFKFAVAVR